MGAALAPVILIVFAGRQMAIDINDRGDTAQGRIQLWRDSLVEFHRAPFFGIGYGRLAEEIGLVSHNTYVHCFTELGAFGGTLFFGIIYVMGTSVMKYRRDAIASADLATWLPCVGAILAGFAVGMLSLSRPYTVSTYFVLGTAASYRWLCATANGEPLFMTRRLTWRVVIAGFLCLVSLEIFVRTFAL
jgi:O-antigen ligase